MRRSPRTREPLAAICSPRQVAAFFAPAGRQIGTDEPIGVVYLEGQRGADGFRESDRSLVELFGEHLAPLADRLLLREARASRNPIPDNLVALLGSGSFVGRSRNFLEAVETAAGVAPLNANVLLTGDSGTGKTMLARIIHNASGRSTQPFVELNCAALPETLIESELFGALPGAHSTAQREIAGKISAAGRGTLFLDEISELSLSAQAKLLQFLQSKQFYPLGSSKPAVRSARHSGDQRRSGKGGRRSPLSRGPSLETRRRQDPHAVARRAPGRHRRPGRALLRNHFDPARASAAPSLASRASRDSRRGMARQHRFRHDLLRDAAYESIPGSERARLHRRIATTIREHFVEMALQRPAELASHFERGEDGMTAAEYWHQAGNVAMASATYLDALQHFDRGLDLVVAEPPSPQRAQRELALTTAVATAHLSTEGFGAASTREAFAKARVMCTTLGREAPLEILGGIFGAALASSDNEETVAVLPLFEALSMRTDQPMHAFAGHQVLGVHSCWSGNHQLARVHTSAAMELYRRSSVRDISWEYGFGLYSYGYGMSALFHLGHVDEAEAVQREMLALAESSHHPYCIALALGFATTLTGDLCRPQQTIELATRLLGIASEQHLYLWTAFAMCAQGQALVQLGRAEDGITPIRMGVGLLETLGFQCSHGYYLMYLVEALLELGELDEALAVADQGLSFYKERWTRFAEPNMVRLRGTVLEKRGDLDGARAHYARAIAIARADGSKVFEGRAETALHRLTERVPAR